MNCLLFFKKPAEHKQQKTEQKQTKRVEKEQRRDKQERERDALRQTDPEGLLKIALESGWRRRSFTAADPGKFYRKAGHWAQNDQNDQNARSEAKDNPFDDAHGRDRQSK